MERKLFHHWHYRLIPSSCSYSSFSRLHATYKTLLLILVLSLLFFTYSTQHSSVNVWHKKSRSFEKCVDDLRKGLPWNESGKKKDGNEKKRRRKILQAKGQSFFSFCSLWGFFFRLIFISLPLVKFIFCLPSAHSVTLYRHNMYVHTRMMAIQRREKKI